MTRANLLQRSSLTFGLVPTPLALVALGLGLGACASGPRGAEKALADIEFLTRSGEYQTAALRSVELLDQLEEDSQLRERAESLQRHISLASGLDRVRTLSLADEDDAALALLAELDEAHPNTEAVLAWQQRTGRKLADHWFSIAREAQADEHFGAAREAYAKAVRYDVDHPVAASALEGLDRVEAYRAGVAEDYYYEGVRAFTEELLSEARASYGKVLRYNEGDPRTKRRIREVDKVSAKARADYGELLVLERRFSAAAREYLVATELDPTNEALAKRYEELRRESLAFAKIGEASFAILRGEVEVGEGLLAEARELTVVQAEDVDAQIEGIGTARADAAYQRALDLEHDFRFAEAVEGYALLLESEGFFKDARARMDSLKGYMADSDRLYGEAAAAESPEKKLELLRQIDLIWPEYKDVSEQIIALDTK